jgi:hypothetical protein
MRAYRRAGTRRAVITTDFPAWGAGISVVIMMLKLLARPEPDIHSTAWREI